MPYEIRSRYRALAPLWGAAALMLLGGCAALSPRPPTPIADVIKRSNSEQPEQVIRQIRTSNTTYALNGSDFPKLVAAGVPPAVLDELQQGFFNDVDLLTRNWVSGGTYRGCLPCYPQPVELSNLSSGGNGMGDTSRLGREPRTDRPEGLPDWVTAVPGSPRAPGLTLPKIEAMVKDGRPSAEIAAQIRASRLYDFLGVKKDTFGAHSAAGVTGSDYARLATEGASDEVLDALQQKLIAEFIEYTRLTFTRVGPAPSSVP
jgi:hypothetical protein